MKLSQESKALFPLTNLHWKKNNDNNFEVETNYKRRINTNNILRDLKTKQML